MHGKLRQARPSRGIHVRVGFVRDHLLVEMVDVDLLLAVRGLEQVDEVALELVAEVADRLLRVLADQEHLPHVALALDMAFEAILIAAGFFARLAVPAESCQSL